MKTSVASFAFNCCENFNLVCKYFDSFLYRLCTQTEKLTIQVYSMYLLTFEVLMHQKIIQIELKKVSKGYYILGQVQD